jgi:hypothetical protein
VHLGLGASKAEKIGSSPKQAPTSVSLFDQGLTEVLQAAVTGLEPKQSYVLSLAGHADGSGGPVHHLVTGSGRNICVSCSTFRQLFVPRSTCR